MNRGHRVFIAINLPEKIKKRLADYQNNWLDLPAKWTKTDNLHITLEFIGEVSDNEPLDIIKEAKELASKTESFEVNLNKIIYGPLRPGSGQATPRMVWVTGDKIKELNLNPARNATHSVAGGPHITLARIRKWDWQRIEPEERPVIDEDINISFQVDSIEVMESVLKKGGPQYTILESISLK